MQEEGEGVWVSFRAVFGVRLCAGGRALGLGLGCGLGLESGLGLGLELNIHMGDKLRKFT